tara:strand:+ start:97 stop:399 length:303 start_codon:yes stop_codon:yes gene_type:complete
MSSLEEEKVESLETSTPVSYEDYDEYLQGVYRLSKDGSRSMEYAIRSMHRTFAKLSDEDKWIVQGLMLGESGVLVLEEFAEFHPELNPHLVLKRDPRTLK